MRRPQIYRLRAPGSGREALVPLEEDKVYVDRTTGEELQVVGKALPLAPSESALPRTPENLRICPHCKQLVGIDVTGCVAGCTAVASPQASRGPTAS